MYNDVFIILCMYECFDQCFLPRDNSHSDRSYPAWYFPDIKRLIKEKYLYHKLWKITKQDNDYNFFNLLRKKLKHEIKLKYKNYIRTVENNIVNDPLSFWNLINSTRKNRQKIDNMTLNGKDYAGDGIIANAFANFFKSVFNDSPNRFYSDDVVLNYFTAGCLSIDSLSISELHYGFKNMKAKKSSGPDLIPTYILKSLRDQVKYPLLFIFNLSLKTSIFPDAWKLTKVIPLHKKGDKSMIENYRPISILCSPAKIFEIIIHKYAVNHIEGTLIDQQHGFRVSRSVTTNLLCFSKYVTKISIQVIK